MIIMVKKNREPAFGSDEYYLLCARRHRLRAFIEDDPMKRKEYLRRARAAQYLASVEKPRTSHIVYA